MIGESKHSRPKRYTRNRPRMLLIARDTKKRHARGGIIHWCSLLAVGPMQSEVLGLVPRDCENQVGGIFAARPPTQILRSQSLAGQLTHAKEKSVIRKVSFGRKCFQIRVGFNRSRPIGHHPGLPSVDTRANYCIGGFN
jgi:hypothetical protein